MKTIPPPFLIAFFVLLDLIIGIYAIVQYYRSANTFSLIAGIILIIAPILILITNFLLQRNKKM